MAFPFTIARVQGLTGGKHSPPLARTRTCGCSRPIIWDSRTGHWRHLSDMSLCRPARAEPLDATNLTT